MSVYLVTREGQELGTFKTSRIEKGLKTGFFRLSDLGWCEASGWRGLFEIAGSAHAPADIHHGCAANIVVPPTLIEELADTRPWVRIISVVMGIGCALMIPACLLQAVDGTLSFPAPFAQNLKWNTQHLILTATCLLAAILILYPAVKLSNYASNIALLAKSQSLADLAAALDEQRRFWKFSGILMIIQVTLALLLFITSFFVTRVH